MKKYFGVQCDPDSYAGMLAGLEGFYHMLLQKFDKGEPFF
jgi:hypothetical protein